MEISFFCHPNSNAVIAAIFGIWNNCWGGGGEGALHASVRVSRDVPPFRHPFSHEVHPGTPSGWVFNCQTYSCWVSYFRFEPLYLGNIFEIFKFNHFFGVLLSAKCHLFHLRYQQFLFKPVMKYMAIHWTVISMNVLWKCQISPLFTCSSQKHWLSFASHKFLSWVTRYSDV